MVSIARLLLVGLAIVFGFALGRRGHARARRLFPAPAPAPGRAAFAPDARREGGGAGAPFVRPAGRESMRDPPRKWDLVDEASDASFPSSDPLARY